MIAPGPLHEVRRHGQHLRSGQRERPVQLREPEVVADGQPDRDIVHQPRRPGRRRATPGPTRCPPGRSDRDIEQVDLAVGRRDRAVRGDQRGGVVRAGPDRLRSRPCCRPGSRRPDGARPRRRRPCAGRGSVERTPGIRRPAPELEVLRQCDEAGTGGGRVIGERDRPRDVPVDVVRGVQLDQRDLERHALHRSGTRSPQGMVGPRRDGGTGSDWRLTVPSGSTANVHVCRSMQPAWQSPQPTWISTMKAPTPEAGVTLYQADCPMRSARYGGMVGETRVVGDDRGDGLLRACPRGPVAGGRRRRGRGMARCDDGEPGRPCRHRRRRGAPAATSAAGGSEGAHGRRTTGSRVRFPPSGRDDPDSVLVVVAGSSATTQDDQPADDEAHDRDHTEDRQRAPTIRTRATRCR